MVVGDNGDSKKTTARQDLAFASTIFISAIPAMIFGEGEPSRQKYCVHEKGMNLK
jgi:hypothetical protein